MNSSRCKSVLFGCLLWTYVARGQAMAIPKSAFEVYHIELDTSGVTTGNYFTIEGSLFRAHVAKVSDLFTRNGVRGRGIQR